MSIRSNFDDVYSLFDRFDDGGMAIDVMDDDETFVVTADLPGVEREDVSVSLQGRALTIEAETETNHVREGNDETATFVRRERSRRSLGRTVRLPASVVAEDVNAELTNGVLTITLPKVETDLDGTRIDVR